MPIVNDIEKKILFLSKCFRQTILVDDASKDGAYLYLKSFLAKNNISNVEIILNRENMGPGFSRNVGIKNLFVSTWLFWIVMMIGIPKKLKFKLH